MKSKIYSIYDGKAVEYGPLFLAKNDDVAIRMCRKEFDNMDMSVLVDFSLFTVGVFDSEDGYIDSACSLVEDFDNIFYDKINKEADNK